MSKMTDLPLPCSPPAHPCTPLRSPLRSPHFALPLPPALLPLPPVCSPPPYPPSVGERSHALAVGLADRPPRSSSEDLFSRQSRKFGAASFEIDGEKIRGRQTVEEVRKTNPHLFKPGWKGGPGRPPGMRNRLSETFLQALNNDFAEHGAAAIEKVRREKTHVYLSVIASLCPRQLSIERTTPFSDLTDEELDQLQRFLSASRAHPVAEIDGKADE